MDSWVEKYSPKSLDDVIMSDKLRETLRGYLEQDTICNMTLAGTAGIGKTTTANIIVENLKGKGKCIPMYLNASDENGIETVRTKIKTFIERAVLEGEVKILILDEADGLTKDGQKALRSLMETDLEDTRFILTCNHPENIIDPLYSRAPKVDISYNLKDALKRVLEILIAEGIDVNKYKHDIVRVVRENFPDLRNTLNQLERCFVTGEFVYIEAESVSGTEEVVDFINANMTDIVKCRQHWIDNTGKFNNDYSKLGSVLVRSIEDSMLLVSITDRYYMAQHVSDRELGFYLLVLAIKQYKEK